MNSISVGYRDTETFLGVDYRFPQAIFTHPSYNNESFDNAFAIVQLVNSSTNEFVKLNTNPHKPGIAAPVTALGAGGGGMSSNVLQQVQLVAMQTSECEATRNRAGFPIVVSNSTLCASGGELDVNGGFCEDDWGGPLILQEGNNNTPSVGEQVQVGVISWTLGCASGAPGVFSRVSDAYDWIRSTLCAHSVAPPAYLACATGLDVNNSQALPIPAHNAPTSPISFQYEIGADGYFYENGRSVNVIGCSSWFRLL